MRWHERDDVVHGAGQIFSVVVPLVVHVEEHQKTDRSQLADAVIHTIKRAQPADQ